MKCSKLFFFKAEHTIPIILSSYLGPYSKCFISPVAKPSSTPDTRVPFLLLGESGREVHGIFPTLQDTSLATVHY